MTAWVRAHFPRLIAAVDRLHPAERWLFAGIDSPGGAEAPLALATLLERLDALAERRAAAVLETFTRRGVGTVERGRLRALVEIAMAAPEPGEPELADAWREVELVALHRWYADWCTTARACIARKDWLIALGLAGRRRANDGRRREG